MTPCIVTKLREELHGNNVRLACTNAQTDMLSVRLRKWFQLRAHESQCALALPARQWAARGPKQAWRATRSCGIDQARARINRAQRNLMVIDTRMTCELRDWASSRVTAAGGMRRTASATAARAQKQANTAHTETHQQSMRGCRAATARKSRQRRLQHVRRTARGTLAPTSSAGRSRTLSQLSLRLAHLVS